MDSKNTIAAIALSSAVIVLWALFFVPEKSTVDQNIVEKEKIEQSGDAPSSVSYTHLTLPTIYSV